MTWFEEKWAESDMPEAQSWEYASHIKTDHLQSVFKNALLILRQGVASNSDLHKIEKAIDNSLSTKGTSAKDFSEFADSERINLVTREATTIKNLNTIQALFNRLQVLQSKQEMKEKGNVTRDDRIFAVQHLLNAYIDALKSPISDRVDYSLGSKVDFKEIYQDLLKNLDEADRKRFLSGTSLETSAKTRRFIGKVVPSAKNSEFHELLVHIGKLHEAKLADEIKAVQKTPSQKLKL